MTQSILLVGATGMLGAHIARELLALPDAHVRLLLRDTHDPEKTAGLQSLRAMGAETVEGDLADRSSLDRATQGIEVIVSAVQGGPEVIVDGQVALAEAGKRNGARRMLPSDYAMDLFKATSGEHPMFDMRRQADERISKIGLEQINVLQGGFMDLFMPGNGAIDLEAGTVSFFGDGTRPVEVTSVADTARMIARVALDRSVPAGKFAFAGDRVSFREAGETVARLTGKTIKPVSMGSEETLRAAMAKADPQKKVMLAYLLYMTNGQTALENVQNSRYADMRWESFADYAARTLPKS